MYDIWYTSLTPDREFPAEVRRLLNTGLGQLAGRARQLDLRLVMNDLCELVMEQVGACCVLVRFWVLGRWAGGPRLLVGGPPNRAAWHC